MLQVHAHFEHMFTVGNGGWEWPTLEVLNRKLASASLGFLVSHRLLGPAPDLAC